MVTFFSTLFLGLIAAIIGATIQQRTWRHRSLEELKEREYTEARKAVEELSKDLDIRIEAQRNYTRQVLNNDITDQDIEEYKKAITTWMGGFSSHKSRIYHSFGKSCVYDFEDTVQVALQNASAVVGLGRRYGVDGLCTRDKKLFLGSEIKLNVIQYDIYRFLNRLNEHISKFEIGRSHAINNLNKYDVSMVSRLYLVRKLLGIEGDIRRTY